MIKYIRTVQKPEWYSVMVQNYYIFYIFNDNGGFLWQNYESE